MDTYKNIEELLEKYWIGETSSAEEKALRDFFVHAHHLPSHLQQYADLFIIQHEQGELKVSDDFEQKLLQKITPAPTKRTPFTLNPFTLHPVPLFFKVAASIIIILGIGLFTYQHIEKQQATLLAQAEARETIIDALSMISDNLQKGEEAIDEGLKQFEILSNYTNEHE